MMWDLIPRGLWPLCILCTDIRNSSVRSGTFPEELKLAEVTPFFKRTDPFDKVNTGQ